MNSFFHQITCFNWKTPLYLFLFTWEDLSNSYSSGYAFLTLKFSCKIVIYMNSLTFVVTFHESLLMTTLVWKKIIWKLYSFTILCLLLKFTFKFTRFNQKFTRCKENVNIISSSTFVMKVLFGQNSVLDYLIQHKNGTIKYYKVSFVSQKSD